MGGLHDMGWPGLRCCAGASLLVVGLGGCGSGGAEPGAPRSESGCPQLEPGEHALLDANVRLLANPSRPVGYAPFLPTLIADAGDVYWFDGAGSVFVERQGEARAVELKRSEEPESPALQQVVLGLATNADRVFVGDAFLPTELIDDSGAPFQPPARLLSISKQDGHTEVLLEEQDRTLAPVAADAERVVVFSDEDGGFYQVRFASPQLERLPLSAPRVPSQLVGDQLYWLNNRRVLLRSGFDDVEPEAVMTMSTDGYFFSVGPGYILSQQSRILPGYYYAGLELVVSDGSGCHAMPGPQSSGPMEPALDAQYAYWAGYQAPQATPAPDPFRLLRVDVESGAFTLLNVPGFTPEGIVAIAGQDDTRLFLRSFDTLIEVQKP